MMLWPGDTQELPGVGVFKWDGREFWVFGDMKRTHGEMYLLLKSIDKQFNVISVNKDN